ncbi:MAG: hypothetical protein V5B36_04540 [Candidatus Accumulibacter sp. UW25]
MPPQYQAPADGDQARRVADYIAGMTDRYAIKEHRRCLRSARAEARRRPASGRLRIEPCFFSGKQVLHRRAIKATASP